MSTGTNVDNFEQGLRSLLELCENLFGKCGKPILINNDSNNIELTKNSQKIIARINTTTKNPLVKFVTNFALDQAKFFGDHSLYLVILALNFYFRLKVSFSSKSVLNNELSEIEKILEKIFSIQGAIHRSFDKHFENLVQIVLAFCSTKLYNCQHVKLENFCKILVVAFLQTLPDLKNDETLDINNWFKPQVIYINEINLEEFKTGEIVEGIFYSFNIPQRIQTHFDKVINMRSFTRYEKLYREVKCMNALILEIEELELDDLVLLPRVSSEDILLNQEDQFVRMLDEANVGLILSSNVFPYEMRQKFRNNHIFYLHNISKSVIELTERAFKANIMKSTSTNIAEYIFQIESPTIRKFQNSRFLVINRSMILTVVIYRSLDEAFHEDENLANPVFDLLIQCLVRFHSNSHLSRYLTSICHGSGCTEFLLAGILLRYNQPKMLSPNYWLNKPTSSSISAVKNEMALSFLQLWKLNNPNSNLNNQLIVSLTQPIDALLPNSNVTGKFEENLINNCMGNMLCVCNQSRQNNYQSGVAFSINEQLDDIAVVKLAAIKAALRIVKFLINTDGVYPCN